jgi:L-lactate dehydrogenase (cytochrome)
VREEVIGPAEPAAHPAGRLTAVQRRVPRWSDVRPLVRFRAPRVGSRARLEAAATVGDVRRLARRRTPRAVFEYVDGAAESELSLARSWEAFSRVEFRPRVLRGVTKVDVGTTILGRPASMPLILAPTGFTRMMQYEGEPAVARAAQLLGVPYVLSTMGTTSPEDVAAAAPGCSLWFQLYLWRDRGASRELLARASAAGFTTLMLTVDTPVAGLRLRDIRNGLTIPPSLTLKTLLDMSRHPSWWLNLLTTEPLRFAALTDSEGPLADLMDRILDPSVTVEDLRWLRGVWPGPLVVKGIQTAQDARMVVEAGADAVVVSNHGGRQLDRATTPLEELPAVVDAVAGQAEVYLDGGITNGADVVACVGVGATACLIGRAYLYGLMAGGRLGVERVLQILRSEMVRTMFLIGAGKIDDLDPEVVRLRP